VDYPRKDILYTNCEKPSSDLYGRGFTIWKTLPPRNIDRSAVLSELREGAFDLVIFGSVWRQDDLFNQFEKDGLFSVDGTQYAFLDGEDFPEVSTGVLGWGKNFIKRILPGYNPQSCYEHIFGNVTHSATNPLYSPALKYGRYVKRELEGRYLSGYADEIPILPISFSIPSEKIRSAPLNKSNLYPRQVQCDEAYKVEEINQRSTAEHIFTEEHSYYEDLASAKYGITQRKAGWECMRHYEIAANLAVPCFYNLTKKPYLTAPHGLRDLRNCIAFNSASDLRAKVQHVEQRGYYDFLLQGTKKWVKDHTCEKVAVRLLRQLGFSV